MTTFKARKTRYFVTSGTPILAATGEILVFAGDVKVIYGFCLIRLSRLVCWRNLRGANAVAEV